MLSMFIAAVATPVAAGGAWAAFDQGSSCQALAQPIVKARPGKVQPMVAIRFERDGSRLGEVAVRLRRPARAGSSVVLTIGDRPFLLDASGAMAWSRDPAQQQALLAAMRAASGMRIEARDSAGRRMVDRYLLAGAPTALDAAAACAARR